MNKESYFCNKCGNYFVPSIKKRKACSSCGSNLIAINHKRASNKGTCTCGNAIEKHISKEVLTQHHYWYMHENYVEGCAICEKNKI